MSGEVGSGEFGTASAETVSAESVSPAGDNGGAVNTPQEDQQDDKTVRRLRFGVAAIGLLLPAVLPFGNWIFVQFGHHTQIMPSSMSSSYYTSTRNIFVGSLCALGVFLIGYRAKPSEDLWTTVVGLFALGVALFPTAPVKPTDYQSTVGYVHLSCAGVLLSGLAVFCITSFHRDSKASPETTNYSYLTAGVAILVFLLIAIIAGVTHWGDGWTVTPLYACEALSVWAFGGAWLVAAIEIGRPASAAAARKTPRPRRRTLAFPR